MVRFSSKEAYDFWVPILYKINRVKELVSLAAILITPFVMPFLLIRHSNSLSALEQIQSKEGTV